MIRTNRYRHLMNLVLLNELRLVRLHNRGSLFWGGGSTRIVPRSPNAFCAVLSNNSLNYLHKPRIVIQQWTKFIKVLTIFHYVYIKSTPVIQFRY